MTSLFRAGSLTVIISLYSILVHLTIDLNYDPLVHPPSLPPGLDPAGPYYENTDPAVRLDPTDATFVDVIHSDGKKLIQLGL